LIDQNEASVKRIRALQLSVEELSHEFQGFQNDTANCSQELRNQVIDSQERLSSLEPGAGQWSIPPHEICNNSVAGWE
jgi:TolA-binding protein